MKLSLGLVALIVFSSCRKEIDIDLRSVEPILVVQGEICEGEYARVKLTSTRDYYDTNNFPPITDAVVSISNNKGESEQLTNINDSIFISETMVGEEGENYLLSVLYDGKTYTSQSKILPAVPIDSVVLYSSPFLNRDMLLFTLYYTDPPGKEIDYYRFIIYADDEKILANRNMVASADILDGTQLKATLLLPSTDENDEKIIEDGTEINFEMLTIDKPAFLFFNSLGSTGKTNPTSNIEGGALGYFSAYSKFNIKYIVEKL